MMHRPSRRTSAVIAAAACLLAGGVVTGAQAMRPLAHPVAVSPVVARPVVAHPGAKLHLPKPPVGKGWTSLGLSVDRSVQEVKRAKLHFNVKPFRAFTWLQAIPT